MRRAVHHAAPPLGVAPAKALPIELRVNGRTHWLAADAPTPLLLVLRNDLGLNGPKYGCGLGECGSCTVLVDGVAARACAVPVGGLNGRSIVTLEGLPALAAGALDRATCAPAAADRDGAAARSGPADPAGRADEGQTGEPDATLALPLHPVQQAFVDEQAAQCGYCLNGMVMAAVALLERRPQADEAQIRAALSHNLCRCGTHLEILAAVRLARDRMWARRAPESSSDGQPGDGPLIDVEAGDGLGAAVGDVSVGAVGDAPGSACCSVSACAAAAAAGRRAGIA